MSDDTYIEALRAALRIFRTAATMLGHLDREIEAAWDAHDVERAMYLEQVSETTQRIAGGWHIPYCWPQRGFKKLEPACLIRAGWCRPRCAGSGKQFAVGNNPESHWTDRYSVQL